MLTPSDRQPGVLLLLADPAPLQPLLTQLQQVGMQVDLASDLATARTLFFASGGHDCLVIAPDVRPGIASQVVHSLRSVDPDLPMATFGPDLGGPTRPSLHAILSGFHPSSRAGTGALLRFLRAMRLR